MKVHLPHHVKGEGIGKQVKGDDWQVSRPFQSAFIPGRQQVDGAVVA